jgi:glycerol-3-phosphate O-acyltransferase
MATQSGVCQAVFLEGGLSRDGLLAEPKLGFLDYILRNYDWQTDRDVVFVPVGINYDRVLEDENLLAWDRQEARLTTAQHLAKLWRFLRINLFAGSRKRWKRYGYASVNFGVPISMRSYSEERGIDFNHLEKEQRIVKVIELAESLMQSLRYVMPIIPVPIICAVLLRADDKPRTSLEIIGDCDTLIDEMIEKGAAMKTEEKPRQRTLARSLDMLLSRNFLIETDDHYQINPEYKPLIQYYANSIEHWWKE